MQRPPRGAPIEVRLNTYIDRRGDDECWLWLSSCDKHGYGRLSVGRDGKRLPELAHRLAYKTFVGPVADHIEVRHTCDNPPCCNYKRHLKPGSHRQNMKDFATRGHGNRGESNGRSKLTAAGVYKIRALFASGNSVGAISKQLNLKHQLVSKIVRGDRWKQS